VGRNGEEGETRAESGMGRGTGLSRLNQSAMAMPGFDSKEPRIEELKRLACEI